jgi:glycosyltransferase involved in cell wall biosynthesis
LDYSVVIPCYNRRERLLRALRGALEQTLPPREVIVVDDGSTDRSFEAAAGLGAPVRALRTVNRGPSAARNLGIAEARQPWVAFLDSDDLWLPDKMALQAQASRAHPEAGLVFCDTLARRGDRVFLPSRFALGGVYEAAVERADRILRFDRSLLRYLLQESRIFTSAVVARRDLPSLRFPEGLREAEDWALWLELIRQTTFVAVDSVLVEMDYADDNLSARRGRVLHAGVGVLESLLDGSDLSAREREEAERALAVRRRRALYETLRDGRQGPARRYLSQHGPREIGLLRWLGYRLLASLPAALSRRLAPTGHGQGG